VFDLEAQDATAAVALAVGVGVGVFFCRPYPILTGTAYNERGDDGYALYPLEVRSH